MESRAKLFGHPIHQMLIVFPLGLLATALVFDAANLITANGYWSEIAFWMIGAGVVTGLLAAPATPTTLAFLLAFAGGGLALFTGWLGGELVDRLSVGVDDGAHIDAPSSLRTRRIRA